MLPVAPATPLSHVLTRRIHSTRGWIGDAHHARPREVTFHLDVFDVDRLAGQAALNEDDATVGTAGHCVAAGDESFNLQ
jgi:hypothetical protein